MPKVYDDQEQDQDTLKGLEESFHGPSATTSGSQKLYDAKKLQEYEDHPPKYDKGLGKASAGSIGGEVNATPSDTVGSGYNPGGKPKGRVKSFLGRMMTPSGKKKILIAGAVVSTGGLATILILLFLLASSLAIPNLAQNITTYEFAHVTRDYAKSASRLTTEDLAIQATDDTFYGTLKAKFASIANATSEQWARLDKYRPQKVMQNLVSDNNFKITYKRTLLGRQQLVGVTIADAQFTPVAKTALQRFTPGLNSLLDFKNNVNLAKTVGPALDSALRDKDIGPIVRWQVSSNIRKELGISLVAWTLGDYKGKSEAQARLAETREKVAAVDEGTAPVNDAVTDTTKNAVDQAEAETKAVTQSDAKLQAVINSGGIAASVKAAINSALQKSGLSLALNTGVGIINPIYGIAMPICMIYDGSLDHSGGTIDNQTAQQQRSYYFIASAADQQKNGTVDANPVTQAELGAAVRATAEDIGDQGSTKIMQRANGAVINSSDMVSAEASAGGEYTLLNATLPGPIANTINALADGACPYLTNIWGGIGLGLLNIGIGFLSGGSSAAGEEAAGAAATTVIEDASTSLVAKLFSKVVTTSSKVKSLLFDTAKSAGKVVAATVIAKLIVNARCGCINSGFSQGTNLADQATAGADINAGEVDRQGLYGRPETSDEISQSDSQDTQDIQISNASKSTYDRYFATSNANSLVSRMAMALNSNMNTSIFKSIISIGSSLLHPLTYMGSLTTHLTVSASAGVSPVVAHFGNVQFGWPLSEQKLIDSKEDYHSSLENQQALDASGKEGEISSKYGTCFTDTIGNLLSLGEIVRDADGNVIPDKGLCSPNNLGVNNSQYGDLVFRWRLANNYQNTIKNLQDTQDITSGNSNTDGTTSPVTVAPSGLNTGAAEAAAKAANANGVTVGYALYDAGGANISTFQPDTANYGASITKSMLLVAYLNQIGSGALSATATSNLTAMIENSDNTAANWVYHQLTDPAAALSKVAADAGMTGFNMDTSDATYVLGQSTITSADFARFFAAINSMINGTQQAFGLNLLSHLSAADQTGLLQAGLPGTVYSKEGWKPEPTGSRGTPYIVNQAAQFTLNGRTYGVAVTVGGVADQASGEAVVKSIVSALMK